jgi:hypothetical protein
MTAGRGFGIGRPPRRSRSRRASSSPGGSCVDERLIPLGGRLSHRQRLTVRPAKVDSRPHVGTQPERDEAAFAIGCDARGHRDAGIERGGKGRPPVACNPRRRQAANMHPDRTRTRYVAINAAPWSDVARVCSSHARADRCCLRNQSSTPAVSLQRGETGPPSTSEAALRAMGFPFAINVRRTPWKWRTYGSPVPDYGVPSVCDTSCTCGAPMVTPCRRC